MSDKKTTDRTSLEETGKTVVIESACAAPWDSIIGNTDDGKIDVRVDDTGKITGTHINTNKPIDGQCTPGRPHHIHFARRDTAGCTFTYDGVIARISRLPSPGLPPIPIPFGLVIGKVTTSCPSKLDQDDDWVGTHTT